MTKALAVNKSRRKHSLEDWEGVAQVEVAKEDGRATHDGKTATRITVQGSSSWTGRCMRWAPMQLSADKEERKRGLESQHCMKTATQINRGTRSAAAELKYFQISTIPIPLTTNKQTEIKSRTCVGRQWPYTVLLYCHFVYASLAVSMKWPRQAFVTSFQSSTPPTHPF